MATRTGRSRLRRTAASSCPERLTAPFRGAGPAGDGGFTLVEVVICTLVLTIGMLAIAALLAVSTQMQVGAREGARSARLAQDKIDALMKLDFATSAQIAVGGSLTANVANHSETLPSPLNNITLRWKVDPGPTVTTTDTRVVTVRVVNLRTPLYRQTDLSTIIRKW